VVGSDGFGKALVVLGVFSYGCAGVSKEAQVTNTTTLCQKWKLNIVKWFRISTKLSDPLKRNSTPVMEPLTFFSNEFNVVVLISP